MRVMPSGELAQSHDKDHWFRAREVVVEFDVLGALAEIDLVGDA